MSNRLLTEMQRYNTNDRKGLLINTINEEATTARNSNPAKGPTNSPIAYIQSPIDDLESFFYTTLWAVVFNIHNTPNQDWRTSLQGTQKDRSSVVLELLFDPPGGETIQPPIVIEAAPILSKWRSKLKLLRNQMDQRSRASGVGGRPVDHPKIVEWNWHVTTVNGVCDFLEILKLHRQELQSVASFPIIK